MTRALLFILVFATACEDSALVETIADLDQRIATRRTEAKMLMTREQTMPAGTADPLATGDPAEVQQHLERLAVGDEVKVVPGPGSLEVHLVGRRGRRQAAQSLIRFGVEGPSLKLERVDAKQDDWTMVLRLPRTKAAEATKVETSTVTIPEPSFFSFSSGDALYERAQQRAKQLRQLDTIVRDMKARQARRARAAVAAADETQLETARRRRHLAILLLPSVRDGSLTFADERATWKGEAGFADLADAKQALAARGEVVGFAPGPRGSLTVELK